MGRLLLNLLLAGWALGVAAQGMYAEFGPSPYRHLDRTWFYVEKDMFRVYYHQGGKALAEYVLQMAPQHLRRLEDSFDYHMLSAINVILFTSYNEWRASNFPLELTRPKDYGTIPIRTNEVVVFYDGNRFHLTEQLRDGLAGILLSDLFFGGTLQERIQNAFLLTVPRWTYDGFQKTFAWEWDAAFDDWLRQAVQTRRLRWFNQLTEYDRHRYAYAFWRYIRRRYGLPALRSILYIAQMQKNLESALYTVTGKNLGALHRAFFRHYRDRLGDLPVVPAPEETVLLPRRWKRWEVLNVRFSSDGRYVALTLFQNHRYRLLLGDLQKKAWTVLRKEGTLQDYPYADRAYFVTAFQPGRPVLWVCYPGTHGYHLAPYDISRKKWGEDRLLTFLHKPLAFDVTAAGDAMVFSAIRKGQSDIFYYRFRGHRFRPLTLDPYDDLAPRFSSDGRSVVFTSNRPSDTLWLTFSPFRSFAVRPAFHLFSVAVDPRAVFKKRKFVRGHYFRTAPLVEIAAPSYSSGGTVVAVADAGGVSSLWQFRPDSIYQYSGVVRRYADSLQRPPDTFFFFSPDEIAIDTALPGPEVVALDTFHVYYDTARVRSLGRFSGYLYGYVMLNDGRVRYLRRHPSGRFSVETAALSAPASAKVEAVSPADFLTDRRQRLTYPLVAQPVLRPRQRLLRRLGREYRAPRAEAQRKTYPFHFITPYPAPLSGTSEAGEAGARDSLRRRPRFRHSPSELTFLPNFIRLQLDNSLISSYYFPYIPNQPFYYVPRANALTLARIRDVFRNYVIEAGFRTAFDFSGSDYWFRYINRRHRWVHDALFYRTSLVQANEQGYYFQQVTDLGAYRAVFPISPVFSGRGTFSLRHDKFHFLSLDYPSLTSPPVNNYRVGLKAELVAQDLMPLGFNLYRGYRGKAYYETFSEVAFSGGQRFLDRPAVHILGFDFRYYRPLRRPIVWAQRVSGAASFGKYRVVYYLGGEENWFFPKFNYALPVDAEQQYIYQALAAPLRGFPQNVRNGTRYLLINNELRISIFHLLYGKPIHSSFLESFQFLLFGDVGTAWYRGSPLSMESAIRKQHIESGPFDIWVETLAYPIVSGAGMGLRLEAMGYYWRLDYAWGFERGTPVRRQFYLGVGSDF